MAHDHYVPRFYLAHFAIASDGARTDGLWVYDKSTPAADPRFQSPTSTAVVSDFHTFLSPSGKVRALESEFSKLEGIAAPIVKGWLCKDARPTDGEVDRMAEFVATLWGRVPGAVRVVQETAQVFAEDEIKRLLADPDEMRALVEGYCRETGDTMTVEQATDAFKAVGTGIG
jgi:hypothetical protein